MSARTIRSAGLSPTDRLYTGQRWDGGLGLYDYQARYYHPVLGRFIRADPLVPGPGNPQSLNRFAYVNNNPLRYTDPSGHRLLPPQWRIDLSGWLTPDDPTFWELCALIFVLGGRSRLEGEYLVVEPSVALPFGADFVVAPLAYMVQSQVANVADDISRHSVERIASRLATRRTRVETPSVSRDIVFSGHGEYMKGSGMIVVPEGTEVVTYSKFGGRITDRLGNAIETSQVPPGTFAKVWKPGQKIPNYTLYPPEGLTIQGKPVTVQNPTRLSELLKPGMGRVHWAACTYVSGTKWSGQVWDIGGVWFKNLPK